MIADLEISDFVNRTPSLNLRTPGQLLSLTSHLSFGSGGKETTYHSEGSIEQSSLKGENLLDELIEIETSMKLCCFFKTKIFFCIFLKKIFSSIGYKL